MKVIVVTGGVLSGLGKGIAAASIGQLLSKNHVVCPIKLDGYLNVDPGTMNPVEHGEVFVLADGSEVDMDFGHYERFLGITCSRDSSITMGKVYSLVHERERRGDYLGKTVQLIPHVTDVIKELILSASAHADVALIEVGGTVGDIENEMFIEAVRQLSQDVGRKNTLFVHLAYVPRPGWLGEHKTKPAQQSTQLLLQRGIIPDVIIARSETPVDDTIKQKIARFCNCSLVISGHDVRDVYTIPLNFASQGIVETITSSLGLRAEHPDAWQSILNQSVQATEELRIGIAGKYTALEDSYASVVEACRHAAAHLGVRTSFVWIDTSHTIDGLKIADAVDCVIVPGGFGGRGIDGKIEIIRACRENNIPFLGICYGLQLAVVEFARSICGLTGAHTTEIDANTPHPVVDILEEQREITQKGGTMRLGEYEAQIIQPSIVHQLYGQDRVSERHRHRYEVNPKYHDILSSHGLVFSGMYNDLVEFIELPNHPFFVATQAHPELKSNLDKPAPLFMGLLRAALHQERS